MDRVKTALFDILAPDINGIRVLDLFAGTGAVGIEALSRGAEAATFIELSPDAWRLVRENLALTHLSDRAEVLRADAFVFLHRQRRPSSLRPGLRRATAICGLAARALTQLDATPLTEPDGLVIVQLAIHRNAPTWTRCRSSACRSTTSGSMAAPCSCSIPTTRNPMQPAKPARFSFVDEGEAVRRLNVDRDTLLELVASKRLRAYPGVGKATSSGSAISMPSRKNCIPTRRLRLR